ncbi:hypothetical protein GUJ93_ZPchr0013g36964 [Zizania palustris]|uniref:CP12 domain-containing protein n=1 Tax=Zizania palustris TaxID=103762 RepID=A0A8J5WST9_ZIZPA|nr:hypothetical protein GUJ93_ZPchr0013g36964 [Zizania palustris]
MVTFWSLRTLLARSPAPLPLRQSIVSFVGLPASARAPRRLVAAAASPSTPPELAQKVSKSIKQAEEMCTGDSEGAEYVAAWDEVEELSVDASYAGNRKKDNDPLEEYCKDNPKANECRTYEY